MPEHHFTLLHYAGRSGDHNDLAIAASPYLTEEISAFLKIQPSSIGSPEPALNKGWKEELEAALPNLKLFAREVDKVFIENRKPVIVLSRCSVALATIPIIVKHRPDVVVVWFDAHGDINVPKNEIDFLGGLALSGPLGLWDSGLGSGLSSGNAILAGARDIDPPEQKRINEGIVKLVSPGEGFTERLVKEIRGKPVYVHIDCDVLEPGIVPTDYKVPNGLDLKELYDVLVALSNTSDIVGVQIAELEADSTTQGTQKAVRSLLEVIRPLLA
ncbi:uncharacterized protein IL334_007275 [Kwoniella shivajii]|uniref:Arginase n=1 Tax=Kwoniella shivajii TaxID=564305 RepID=A0ABZ1D9K5_9TREE|nr:hypothetical protein IL334_007275 [Kwoniella shivajii]